MIVVDFHPVQHDLPEDRAYTPTVSQPVLDRHGARILDPATAVVVPGNEPPRSTVYRWGVLLIPDDVTKDHAAVAVITSTLAEIGLRLELGDDDQRSPRDESLPADSNPMRTVALRADELFEKPVIIDAWYALQHLQAAAKRRDEPIPHEIVSQISMDLLLFSASVTALGGAPNEGSGLAGIGYYGREPNIGRLPVALVTDPPRRSQVPSTYLARRPVIAVLDTGIRKHPWLGTTAQGTPPPPGGFLKVWPQLQTDINAANQAAGTSSAQDLHDYWDQPPSHLPLIGRLDVAAGHGTFIVGLIRQAAPDANVLAIRVMGSDGIARGAGVLRALQGVLDRVRDAQDHAKPAEMIDIVSMSMTFFAESDDAVSYKAKLTPIIEQLADRGVLVVAAAGNHSTTRKAFPAAYATELAPLPDRVPVTSVGAYNPNGTKALFSNEGPWVTCFATGAGLVSTYPMDFRGSLTSVIEVPALNRSAYDFDDFDGYGFAIGTGTSFATPLAASALANALIEVAEGTANPHTLTKVDKDTTVLRALTALKGLRA